MSKAKTTSEPINVLRRKEYACDDQWISQFLQRAQVGHLATLWGNQPFITPLLFWYDADRHHLYFHGPVAGRLHTNVQQNGRACFETSQSGALLPSNIALEFTIQYESVVVFGVLHLVEDEAEKHRALYGLIEKYFPGLSPGQDYRPITEAELKRTAVYAFSIESWSGKRNWPESAKQSADWIPP